MERKCLFIRMFVLELEIKKKAVQGEQGIPFSQNYYHVERKTYVQV